MQALILAAIMSNQSDQRELRFVMASATIERAEDFAKDLLGERHIRVSGLFLLDRSLCDSSLLLAFAGSIIRGQQLVSRSIHRVSDQSTMR